MKQTSAGPAARFLLVATTWWGGCNIVGLRPLAAPVQAVDTNRTPSVTVRYLTSTENFANPERGFAPAFDPPWPTQIPWSFCEQDPTKYTFTDWTAPLTTAELASYKPQGISVAMIRYHVAEFRYSSFSQAFLDRLTADFAVARQAGFKLVIRFTYNWPNGGPDAAVDTVLGHLDQLQSVLQKNTDVLAYMELGFIGCWGEMNNSAFQLVDPSVAINANTRAIIDKAFDVLPPERMITVRYPNYQFQYFGSAASDPIPIAPLASTEAFTGTRKARWGHHDDCVVCGEWNYGTYYTARKNAAEIKSFLSEDNKYVVQGGEPGDPDSNPSTVDEDGDGYTQGQYDSCVRSVGEFRQMRWSVLNMTYNLNAPASYNRWRTEGCYDSIAKSLGYRLRLTQSTVPQQVILGGTLDMSFTIVNDGWASPYNPRLLEIVLRNKTGARHRVRLPDDPRGWLPDQTAGYTVTVSAQIPATLAAGQYEVLLSLPDPSQTLYERPEYSIQLANQSVWEASTGYNLLHQSVQLTPGSVAIIAPHAGETVSGVVLIGTSAEASSAGTLQTIQVYVDGKLQGTDTTSQAFVSWNTKQEANGPHSITALATDGFGQRAVSAAVDVTVVNPAHASLAPGGSCTSAGTGAAVFGLLAALLRIRRRR